MNNRSLQSVLIAVVILVGQSVSNGQQTAVTWPTTNTVWYPGDRVTITWDTNAFGQDDQVAVVLNTGKTTVFGVPVGYEQSIYYFGANTGAVDWTVPNASTTDTVFQVQVYSNKPYGSRHSSGFFHIRFGHSRPTQPIVKIQQSIYLTWNATYDNLYEVQSTEDLNTWKSEGYIVADREDFSATLLVSGQNRTFRIVDMGPYWQYQ